MCGHEISVQACASPFPATDAIVKQMREGAVAFVSADKIGGIDGCVWRKEEGLPPTSLGIRRALKGFKSLGKWRDRNRRKSTAVMFGFAAHACRTIAVLERSYGGILDPIKLYAARDGGSLVREHARPGKPETVPSWTNATFDALIDMLKTSPDAFSILEYNGACLVALPRTLPPPS